MDAQKDFARALHGGDVEALADALGRGADPDAPAAHPFFPGSKGVHPLLAALRHRGEAAERCVAVLLAAGADPNPKRMVSSRWAAPGSAFPLKAAIAACSEPIVRRLLEAGADPNARVRGGSSCLAEAMGHPPCVAALLQGGARALRGSLEWGRACSFSHGWGESWGMLAKAWPRSARRHAPMGLAMAARAGHASAARAMLALGASPLDEARPGESVLVAGLAGSHSPAVGILLGALPRGTDPEALESAAEALAGRACQANLAALRARGQVLRERSELSGAAGGAARSESSARL